MRRGFLITTTLLIALAMTGGLAAQDWSGSGRATGTVTDTEGNPVQGAKVHYRMFGNEETGPPPFETNKKGKYAFLGLKGGKWLVHAEAEGYRPSKTVLSDVYSSGVSDKVNLEVEKIPEEEMREIARWEANEFLKEGDRLRKEGKLAEAREQYERAFTELSEDDKPTVYAAIAGTYLNEGKVAEAKEALSKSLAIDPDHVGSLKAMMAIVASEGLVDQAEEMLARVPDDAVIDANTLMNIGMSHYNKGNADLAKPFLDRCVATYPTHPQARYFRGLVNLNIGQNEQAAEDFAKFLELAPDSPDAEQAQQFLDYLQPAPAPAEGE